MNRSKPAQPTAVKPGTLYVVATPIGHLEDLSPRARRVLESVNVVAVEDSRVSGRLFSQAKTRPRLMVVHEHNELALVNGLLGQLRSGHDVALVSDAGTPLISDPGYRLVGAAQEAGLRVSPVPGACAAIAALSVSGLATDRFYFEGFLPARQAARLGRLRALSEQTGTLVFYVPARDLIGVLDDACAALGPYRQAAVARELTKIHETVRRDELAALVDWIRQDEQQLRGEAVVLIDGQTRDRAPVVIDELARELARELPPARAAKVLARVSGMSRRAAWQRIEQVTEVGSLRPKGH